MSFYNTYRPKTLEEIDNEQVRNLITSLLSKKKEDLPHAYFLTGPRGVGKTTTARIIAKLFNCEHPKKTGEPCGSCKMCARIAQGTALDVLEMDAASNTGVDNIRDLKDKIMLSPVEGKWKIYIIDEVHMLSTGAFNALLKTLEEPPRNTIFILATTESQKVPQTIQSRCLNLQFKKPDTKEIVAALSRIAAKEGIKISKETLSMIAQAADGSFRDATKLLEQATLTSKEITQEVIQKILSLPQEKTVATFITLLQKKDAPALIVEIENMDKDGIDIKEFYLSLLKTLQRMLVSLVTTDTPSPWTIAEAQKTLNILLHFYHLIRGNVMPDLALELAILEICEANTDIPLSKPEAKQLASKTITGNLTIEKLQEYWSDVISQLKPVNHSVAGVLRSARPKSIENGTLTIEAFYTFHKDKLSEASAKEAMAATIKTLFGEHVAVEVVLGKK
jgi:DNA polymerase-3 subunit gamma/tau